MAQRGDADAMFRLGLAYVNGDDGLAESSTAGYYWIDRAASAGHPAARLEKARALFYGFGVEEDLRAAMPLFQHAAENGDYEAMEYYATYFRDGKFVSQDFRTAAHWYEKALRGPDPAAHNNSAWFLTTVEDPELLRPALAIEKMEAFVAVFRRPYAIDTLAAAYAAAGDFPKAILTQQIAIDEAVLNDQANQIPEFRQRLESYRAGQRHIEFRRQRLTNPKKDSSN